MTAVVRTPETAVRWRLAQDAAVAALVAARIYPAESVPQAVVHPYVVYQRISRIGTVTNDGRPGTYTGRVQVDIRATDLNAIEELESAIEDALHGQAWICTDDGSAVDLCVLDNSRDSSIDQESSSSPSSNPKRRLCDYIVNFRKAGSQ